MVIQLSADALIEYTMVAYMEDFIKLIATKSNAYHAFKQAKRSGSNVVKMDYKQFNHLLVSVSYTHLTLPTTPYV